MNKATFFLSATVLPVLGRVMEITRPRTCNGNYTPWDLYCTPWESCGEGAYRNLLFYCRGVLTVLKSIHPRRGKKNASDTLTLLTPYEEQSNSAEEGGVSVRRICTSLPFLTLPFVHLAILDH